MPSHQEHRLIAYDRCGHHLGFADDIGNFYFTGSASFVRIKYIWHIRGTGKVEGEAPSRLYRFFKSYGGSDDADESEEPEFEHGWCWDYKSIIQIPEYDEYIDEDILEEMRLDPRKHLEGDVVISDAVESIVSHVPTYRPTNAHLIHPAEKDAIIIVGTLQFDVTDDDYAPKINSVTGFSRWDGHSTVASSPPRPDLIVKPPLVQPCAADDHDCHLAVAVEPGGGPELPHLGEGETLRMRADDFCIFGFEYKPRTGPSAYAYAYGNPYAEPVHAVVVYTWAKLASLSQLDDETRRLLRKPASQRHFLSGDCAGELVPGSKRVKVPRAAITRQVVIASPPLLEGLRVHFSPESVYRFQLVASARGKLTACAQPSTSRWFVLVRSIIAPSPACYRRYVQYSLQETIISACYRNKATDPVEFPIMPYMLALLLCLPGIEHWQRSSIKRDRLVLIFRDDDHFNEVVGFIGWHAPQGKETHGYNKVCVPPPPPSMLATSTTNPAAVPRAAINFFAYDTDTQKLTMRLSVARFNASKRVRGSDVNVNPPTDGERYKYVLSQGWVPLSTRAPTPWELRRAMPGGPAW